MVKHSNNILFYTDEKYLELLCLFLSSMDSNNKYTAFSQQNIEVSNMCISFRDLDNISQVANNYFDFVVLVSDEVDNIFEIVEKNLTNNDYKVMNLREVAPIVLPFNDYINYLRDLRFLLIPDYIPYKESCLRKIKYTYDMHIVMSFNSKFLLPAIGTIYTLFLYNDNCYVHIFYRDLTPNEQNVIERLTKLGNNNRIEWHYITNDLHDKISFDIGRFSIYALYRYLACEILDDKIERALWLDSDLMIRGNIRELYETEMGDECYFASALESSEYENNILGKNREYTNNGVLLMNLKKLRSDDMLDKHWELLFSPDYPYPLSQDALNVVFRYKIRFVLQELWNSFPISYFYGVSDEDYKKIIDNTRIVHWLSAKKAWLPEYELYWETASKDSIYTKVMYEEYKRRLIESVDFVSST